MSNIKIMKKRRKRRKLQLISSILVSFLHYLCSQRLVILYMDLLEVNFKSKKFKYSSISVD